jgi:hypothetical protein
MSINLTYFENLNIGNNQYPWYVPQIAIGSTGTCFKGETKSVVPTTYFPQGSTPFNKEQATTISLTDNSTIWFINPFNYTLCLFLNDKKGSTCVGGGSCLSDLRYNPSIQLYNRAVIIANNDTTLATTYLQSSARRLTSANRILAVWLLISIIITIFSDL